MPIIQCHIAEDVVRRLSVFAALNDREPDELAASWITEAARSAIPCVGGRPVDAVQLRMWMAQERIG